jgi:glucokinase
MSRPWEAPEAPGPAPGQTAPTDVAPVIGVDIGGTKVLAVRLDRRGQVEDEVRVPTPSDGVEVVARIGEVIAALTGDEVPGAVGLGVPGLVGRDGILVFSPHLPGLVGVPLGEHLAALAPGAGIWVGNDATAAGWAEHRRGAGAGFDDVLMVTLGTGIGGGIVAGGRLYEGADRFAGEWGHVVVDPHGPLCPCGKRGCWERFASGSGLGRLGRETAQAGRAARVVELAGGDPESVRGEHVTVAAAEGDAEAADIMAAFAWWLALGLANLANIFDPGVIVIGGGLVDAGEVLMAPARRSFSNLVQAGEQRTTRISPAALGSRAGAIGAGLLARTGADETVR